MLCSLDFCYAYIDDILEASYSEEQHHGHLKQLLQCLQQYGIGQFCQLRFRTAGGQIPRLCVTSNSIRPTSRKNEAISKRRRTQAPMNELLKRKIKGNQSGSWTDAATASLVKTMTDLEQSTLLAHREENAQLTLACDASDSVLQQRIDDHWEPLGFLSKILSPMQARYSAFDREQIAIYLAIIHFCYILEARAFVVYTDHKTLIFTFKKKPSITEAGPTPRLHQPILLCTKAVITPIDYSELADAQRGDAEIQNIKSTDHGLQLKLVQIPGTDAEILCDVSTNSARLFITVTFRRAAFDAVHNLAHRGVKAAVKLMTPRYVWPSIKADHFTPLSARFQHVHIDIIILPPSEGQKYCLTCVNRYTRWPEAFPIPDQEDLRLDQLKNLIAIATLKNFRTAAGVLV
ncbi:uncharacterized protein LOC103315935 [Nasonia vitripennis]|uniref:Reverse transcriptase/retrotransposon-derived protein RNase H-like domain-containing protein n=1 Tax=Nasonia vitripennis TaxID=7425 RepID=A0A7M7HAF7_NASVI|nr:uncharacterized protein LOC103315935 [Nasonia vitripennis]